jgi:hypothetical protein
MLRQRGSIPAWADRNNPQSEPGKGGGSILPSLIISDHPKTNEITELMVGGARKKEEELLKRGRTSARP